MNVGRNDPCPCGSGKKYKHCHLAADTALTPDDLTWQRVRLANDGLETRLLETADRHFGDAALDEAWAAFNFQDPDEEPFDPDSPLLQVFMPWFFHDWLPDPHESATPPGARETTAVQAYLRAVKRLDPRARAYLEACSAAPFSFHEVIRCTPGKGLRLRDVILGDEVDVQERSASKSVATGDLLFARVVPIEGIAVLDGCGTVTFQPLDKTEIVALRARMRREQALSGTALLKAFDAELRALFLDLTDRALHPTLPELVNTDGEPLEIRKLVFDIDAADEVFRLLLPLAAGAAPKERLADAERDADGNITGGEIPWLRAADNMVIGQLRVSAKRLEAEVNSAARDDALRALLAELLGERARFRIAKVESIEQALARAPAPGPIDARSGAEHRPEVRAAVAERLRKHYRAWLDDRIPALGNRTPRDAVRDADGRELVAALIAQIERDGVRHQPPHDPDIVRELREVLGLQPGE